MELLAYWYPGPGPGPWVLFFPLIWVLVVAGVILLVRRFGRARWCGPRPHTGAEDPRRYLGRRFAAGEIDEREYRDRRRVLEESAPDPSGNGTEETEGGGRPPGAGKRLG